MPAKPAPTALYRVHNAEGDLLYIGISDRPEYRWFSHRRKHTWWCEVAQYSLEWYRHRKAAEAAEAEAIRTELPRHNNTYNYSVPFDPKAWSPVEGGVKYLLLAERIRSEIRSGRWEVGYRIPSFEALAEAASVSATVVKKAIGALRLDAVLDWRPGDGTYVLRIPK